MSPPSPLLPASNKFSNFPLPGAPRWLSAKDQPYFWRTSLPAVNSRIQLSVMSRLWAEIKGGCQFSLHNRSDAWNILLSYCKRYYKLESYTIIIFQQLTTGRSTVLCKSQGKFLCIRCPSPFSFGASVIHAFFISSLCINHSLPFSPKKFRRKVLKRLVWYPQFKYSSFLTLPFMSGSSQLQQKYNYAWNSADF